MLRWHGGGDKDIRQAEGQKRALVFGWLRWQLEYISWERERLKVWRGGCAAGILLVFHNGRQGFKIHSKDFLYDMIQSQLMYSHSKGIELKDIC